MTLYTRDVAETPCYHEEPCGFRHYEPASRWTATPTVTVLIAE